MAKNMWEIGRLLVAAPHVRASHAERLAALTKAVDPDELSAFLERYRLLAIAGPRLTSMGLAPVGLARATDDYLQAARDRAGIQLLVTRQLQTMLQRQGVESVALKGPAMALRLHGDLGARGRSSDIDLLVDPDHLAEAARVIQELGWLPPTDTVDSTGRPILHLHLPAAGGGPGIELHWRPHWLAGGAQHGRGIVTRAVSHDGLRVPDPVDELAVLLAAHARDGHTGLRIPADIVAWWGAIDPGDRPATQADLRDRLSGVPALERALTASGLIIHHLVGTPTPTGRPVPTGLRAQATSRLGRVLVKPLPGDSEHIKRAIVDASTSPETVAERWVRPWHPRRAPLGRSVRPVGRLVRRWIVGSS